MDWYKDVDGNTVWVDNNSATYTDAGGVEYQNIGTTYQETLSDGTVVNYGQMNIVEVTVPGESDNQNSAVAGLAGVAAIAIEGSSAAGTAVASGALPLIIVVGITSIMMEFGNPALQHVTPGLDGSAGQGGTLGDYLLKAKDNSKNEKHGDGGKALEKAEKQIKELEKQLEIAPNNKEKDKIKKKIQNIRQTAQKKQSGEEHSKGSKN